MTRADVLRVAKQYVDPAKFVIVAVGKTERVWHAPEFARDARQQIDLTIPAPPKAQTVQAGSSRSGATEGHATLAKMASAMGGEAKLAAVKDITEKAELSLDAGAGGLKAQQTEFWLAPDQYREEERTAIRENDYLFRRKVRWVSSPQGTQPIPDAERKQVSFEIFRMWFPLMTSGADPNRKIEDAANGAIRISDKNGNTVLLSIDPATGLPQSENYSEAGSNGEDVRWRSTPTGRKRTV